MTTWTRIDPDDMTTYPMIPEGKGASAPVWARLDLGRFKETRLLEWDGGDWWDSAIGSQTPERYYTRDVVEWTLALIPEPPNR